MILAVFLIAASAARVGAPSDGKWSEKVLLAVNEEAAAPQSKAEAPESRDAKIEHTPLEKSPRGKTVIIQARILDPSRLFALTTHGSTPFAQVLFRPGDVFVFGSETRGLDSALRESFPAGRPRRPKYRPARPAPEDLWCASERR